MAEAAAAVVVVAATTRLVSLARVVVRVAAEVENSSWTTMLSPLCEQLVPALAATTKVNVKCLSHFTHAFRCE